jgi:hypothetical protein
MTDARIALDRKWFFNYYRQRARNVEALETVSVEAVDIGVDRSFAPDQHVLIAAGLDSLAMHWSKTTRRPRESPSSRFGEFLCRHGGHPAFGKCAVPHLLARGAREKRKDLIQKFQGFMQGFAHRRVFNWSDDPDFVEVLSLVDAPDREWLQRSRYGELLYREYRCGWLHEFQSPTLAPDYGEAIEPQYQNYSRHRRPYFPKVFLLETYQRVVASFERECQEAGTSP